MAQRTLNIALLAALLATLLLNGFVRPDARRPNFEFLPGMVRTARSNAYAESGVLARSMTLQAPVPGTIPRGHPPLHFAGTPEDALRAGRQLSSPLLATPSTEQEMSEAGKTKARGAHLYANFCQICHGPDGAGNGPVVQRGFPGPPSLLADNARNMPDGQLFHVISYGQKNMPPHRRQIGREDRWKVVAHIRALQTKPPAESAAQPTGAQP